MERWLQENGNQESKGAEGGRWRDSGSNSMGYDASVPSVLQAHVCLGLQSKSATSLFLHGKLWFEWMKHVNGREELKVEIAESKEHAEVSQETEQDIASEKTVVALLKH